MIRNDFVSNSSSTSYIISIGKNYPIKTFIKDVSKKCVDKKSKYHVFSLLDRNMTTLQFHIMNTRLLFLGEAYVMDKSFNVDLNKVHKWEDKEEHKKLFNGYMKRILRNKNKKYTEYDTTWEYVSDTKIKGTDHIYQGLITYDIIHAENTFDVMECENNKKFEKEHNEQVIKNIQEFLKKLYTCQYHNPFMSNIFVINKDTIKLTRLMLKNKIKMRFEKWENINKLEKMLDDGETIIGIRIANHGDGIDSDTIYNETDNFVLEDIPVELLTSEIM